jgi:hypothetical protein
MLYSTLEEAYPAANNMANKNKKKKDKEEEPQQKSNVKDCSPLQVPEYKLPIDANSINEFKKAVDVSLNTNKDQALLNNFNTSDVKPYDDFDEYDLYLNISNVQTNRLDNSPEYRTTPLLIDYLKSLRDNYDKVHAKQAIKIDNIEHFTNYPSNKMKVDVNLYNLFLFMFIGIIIILLCDQITKLAVVIASKNI